MPSQLRPDAWCPVCGRPIIAISRTTRHKFFRKNKIEVELEFMHNDRVEPAFYQDHILKGDQEDMDRIFNRLNEVPKPPPGTGRAFFGKPT